MRLKSPAKINLYLKVLKKRKDGYHQIKTLFERIGLFDEVLLKKRKDSRVRILCNHPEVPTDSANLMYKAADLLRKDFKNKSSGLDISLKKRIPVAAGLGGGSSNAASVLLGLNKFWKLRLSRVKLKSYAAKIGSDVPFFVSESSFAIGTGRGDKIKNLPISRVLWHILVVPHNKLSTKEIYSSLNLRLTKNEDNVNMLVRALNNFDLSRLKDYIANDLEASAFRKLPKLLYIKKKLQELGVGVFCLSGSGPAIFGILKSRKEAEKTARSIKSQDLQVFVVRTH
ncbi:MAG TPA: 4-(cytidine 5'-diphospho)-2-C-methyl-D-erythritol kinase [Candidatus Omnitrophota bacterium]|nr:4-(cytidine 5'-diphospho)-2-C-methyl-D-erythritol kinase [Candidatus Omnitrophota bacterium]